MLGHVRRSIYSKRLRMRQPRYGAAADLDVLDGGHIGAIWRMQMNRPSAAATRPYMIHQHIL